MPSALWDTFIIGGVDISSYARIAEVWDAAKSIGAHRGSNVLVPGMPGEVFRKKGREVPVIALGLALLPVDPATGITSDTETGRVAQLNQNYRDLARLVSSRTDVPLQCTRRLSFPGGVQEEHEALVELSQPFAPQHLPGAQGARLTLELRVLDGVWYSVATRIQAVGVPQTVTSNGDTETLAVTAAFSSAATLTNATIGYSLTVDRPCTVDVRNMSADSGATVYGRFALLSGDNQCSATQGTATLTWQEAYL